MKHSGRIHPSEVEKEKGEEPTGVEQAKFDTYVKEQDWLYNHRPCRPDMWRWDATKATVHPSSTLIRESIEKQSKKVFAGWAFWTTQQANDWTGIPTVLGSTEAGARATTEQTFEDGFTKWPKVRVPESAEAKAKALNVDNNFDIIDGKTFRSIEPGSGATIHGHDLSEYGCGYSANSSASLIPFNAASPARVTGGSTNEAGGGSSARVCEAPGIIRFPELKRADEVNGWEDAIPHPLFWLVQGRKAHGSGEAGCAPRGTTKYGEGVVASPADGRLPYVFPAHQGEVVGNEALGTLNEYAPPNGCWFRLNLTHTQVEKLTGPNYVKAIVWALVKYGAFLTDVGGAEGMTFRTESPNSYTYRGDPYATNWLKAHATPSNPWLKEETAGSLWSFNLFAEGFAPTFFGAMQILKPPPKPADLSS